MHGIIYYISNGSSETRILEEKINYIKELNKLYDEDDILTILFTKSLNEITEERKCLLQEELNNENIEIIH